MNKVCYTIDEFVKAIPKSSNGVMYIDEANFVLFNDKQKKLFEKKLSRQIKSLMKLQKVLKNGN